MTKTRYALTRSSLGWLLVAATERGFCAVEMGDAPEELEAAFRGPWPGAVLRVDDPDFTALVRQVLACLEAPGATFEGPLDIRGTDFQRLVWETLRTIPPGTTASYAQIAARIGRPAATRAVARACASNRLAVLIPCHRVVRGDGRLAGYRWGLERKRALLEREKGSMTLCGFTAARPAPAQRTPRWAGDPSARADDGPAPA